MYYHGLHFKPSSIQYLISLIFDYFQRPTPGRYSLQRKSSSNWSGSVNITAQSLVKQETEILENTGALPTLKGSPIAGKSIQHLIFIFCLLKYLLLFLCVI